MPAVIYLFPTYFPVRDVSREESSDCKGLTSYSDREIAIEPSIHAEDKKQVMIHEIIHCILNSGGFRDHDETMLDTLAAGFLNIIRGNSDLIKWLAEVD